jgi:hypothetical protein
MEQTKEQRVCIKFSANLEKLRRWSWQWLDTCSGKKAWAVHGTSKFTETEKRWDRWTAKARACSSFFDVKGIVHRELVLAGQTVNSAYYCDVLRRLSENVRRLRPELWRQKNWLLHHDNAPSHVSFVSREVLTKNMTIVPHQPYPGVRSVCLHNCSLPKGLHVAICRHKMTVWCLTYTVYRAPKQTK